MAKNIVICCDGTGNEIGVNLSNVLKLYRIAEKSDAQRVYYDPGIGTIGLRKTWDRLAQNAQGVFGLATGYGLDRNVLDAYTYLCRTYEEDDRIFLFGFSRGAHTVRVIAGMVHLMGMLRQDQLGFADYALTAYKRAAEENSLEIAWHFRRVIGGRTVPIKFVGVWDTVASVIVPRRDRFYIPSFESLPYTRKNPSVEVFRQAAAIDEFRRMFRLRLWTEPQNYAPNPFAAPDPPPAQDIRQVWFAGCHSDVGGGYPEVESGLSKFPLQWMLTQAKTHGLQLNTAMFNHLVLGKPRKGSSHIYVPPQADATLHKSATGVWRICEWLPKSVKLREWTKRPSLAGVYMPHYEPRPIPEGAFIHKSVFDRMRLLEAYAPINLPTQYTVEP